MPVVTREAAPPAALSAAGARAAALLRSAVAAPAVAGRGGRGRGGEGRARAAAGRRRTPDDPRLPVVLLARSALACVLAFLLASPLPGDSPPLLAALCGLLGVQVTLSATFRTGVQRVLGVSSGVLLAMAFSGWAGLSWWSLGLVVVAAFGLGSALRLGANVVEVPISAMFVLAVQGQQEVAELRVGETLVGAATGVLVNLLLAPPVWVQPAGAAVRAAGEQVAELLLLMSYGLRSPWEDDRAQEWLDAARRLDRPVDRAAGLLEVAQESARYNLRARRHGVALQRVQDALGTTERVALAVRSVCRGLLELPRGVLPGAAPERLAEVLEAASEALPLALGLLLRGEDGDPSALPPHEAQQELVQVLARARAAHDQLGAGLVLEGLRDPASFAAHGALLSLLDRLLEDVDFVVPA